MLIIINKLLRWIFLFKFSFLSHVIVAGLLSWNLTDCHVNLEEELSTITALALEGEEGKNGKD